MRGKADDLRPRARRSCLTVPAVSERFMAKAPDIDVDEIILDLEDSVPLAEKTDTTRLRLAASVAAGGWRARTIAVRINAPSSYHCLLDLIAIVPHCQGNLHCVVIPKVDGPFDVQFVERALGMLERQHGIRSKIGIEVLIETAGGLANCASIAAASPRVEALIFGPADFAASIGTPTLEIGAFTQATSDDSAHAPAVAALVQILTAARAAGVQAVDGPFGLLRDAEGLATSARLSASFGYDGKWAIHPDQIEPLNAIFEPSLAQVRQAEHVLAEYRRVSSEGIGAARLADSLIDEVSLRLAENILRRAQPRDRESG